MQYHVGNFHPVPEQLEAIIHPPAPLLIIAGAGTGKTATLLHRLRYQILKKQMLQENILLLTFTEKATFELTSRLSKMDIPDHQSITVSTFHAFCYSVVQEFVHSDNARATLIENHDIAFMILNRFDELGFLRSRQFRLNPREAIEKAFIPFFGHARDELLSPADLETLVQSNPVNAENIYQLFPGLNQKTEPQEAVNQFLDLLEIYKRFQQWKREAAVVDYGDMIQQCWEGLQQKDILKRVRNKFKHIIVDEYQDNNYALNRIINLIVEHSPSITVVGDEDQCIYSFRGANYYNIHDFRNKYQHHPQFKEIALETNFRSTQPILTLANTSISHDPERTEKLLRSATHSPNSISPQWLVGKPAQVMAYAVQHINEMSQKGTSLEDIAVLCRTTNHVRDAAFYFEQNQIPVQVSLDRFSGIPEIKIFSAWQLVMIDNAQFPVAWATLLKYYQFQDHSGLLNKSFDDLQQGVDLSRSPKLDQFLSTYYQIHHKLKQNAKPYEIAWEILNSTDLLKHSRKYYTHKDRVVLRNMGKILQQAQQFTLNHPHAGYHQWLLYFDLLFGNSKKLAHEPEMVSKGNGVQLMTVHKSKGLEFPVVFVLNLQSGSFPLHYHANSFVNTLPESWFKWVPTDGYDPKLEHMNEERRIFYVALTRARDQLYLGANDKRLSPLMKEIINEPLVPLNRIDIEDLEELEMSSNSNNIKQKLTAEIVKEIHLNHWKNVESLVEAAKLWEDTKTIPSHNPYAYMVHGEKYVEPDVPETLHLSASAVEEYHQCPYKYRLNRLDRIPQTKGNAQMAFGSIVHQILYDFHMQADQPSREQLFSLLDTYWTTDVFEYSVRADEFYKQAQEMLDRYWNYLPSVKSTFLTGEADFTFELPEIQVKINGKIDRIDQEGDILTIIDYKTGNKPASDQTRKSLQLALYTEAIIRNKVKGISGKPGPAQLLYLKNLDELYEPHTFTEGEIKQNLEKVREAAEGIRNHDFQPLPGDFKCNHCDYRDFLCPAWEND